MPERQKKFLSQLGIEAQVLSPAIMSALTSVKIVAVLNQQDISWIMVNNLTDAVAAISARKISKGCRPLIKIEIEPNSEIPKSIPKEVIAGVDAWTFPSHRLMSLYPEALQNRTVVIPEDFSLDWESISPKRDSKMLAWVGPLDGNIDRLKKAIQYIDDSDGYSFKVCGTGKARYVMEAVRKSRGMDHPERVEWIGENFNLAQVLSDVSGIIQAGLDINAVEYTAKAHGWEIITIEDSKNS